MTPNNTPNANTPDTPTPLTRARRVLTVHLEPGNRTLALDKAGAVGAILKRLDLYPDQTLVIRGADLLTPDTVLRLGEEITVRSVGSRG